MPKFKTQLILVMAAIGGGACAPSPLECALVTKSEWRSDFREPMGDMIEGYGAVHDTYVELDRKSEARKNKACEMERIWCPEPYSDKGCQTFSCEHQEVAGALLRAKDHQGERYYKVERDSTVRWNGSTFTCSAK